MIIFFYVVHKELNGDNSQKTGQFLTPAFEIITHIEFNLIYALGKLVPLGQRLFTPAILICCLIGDESRVIIFESKDGVVGDNTDQYIYRQFGDGFYKSVDGLQTEVNLLPDGVVMEDLDILVVGSDPDDDLQPRATFIMEFSYEYRGETIPIFYQTSVTSRTLDVQ